ncbi:aldo/keto reductase [Sphingomonas psychrotolerans]|uniref:Pyridoxal 4-dehydrogenase n=1 Tax=Sphingomonas psychrotolerans TaxID=1327635 RepID=A0A2K8MHX2_9SPHN|nr:aldo/keto reductase [Sphingomonas psychrotolerans]ATY33453.1 pyridoxal 4-dehydrogenase [Sphingomonas psychrotolerans]
MVDLNALGRLGFGAASIGNLYRAMPDEDAAAAVRSAWDAGLLYYDTAPHYGFGLSEKRLGHALAEIDPEQRAILSTKVGRRLDPVPSGTDLTVPRQAFVTPEPFESVFDYSYDAVMRSYEASCARLRRDRIDILYAHDIGRMTHGDDHQRRFAEFMEGGYRAMRELRDSGAVGAIGLGVNETQVCEEVMAVGEIDVVLLAGRYTLLEQEALETFLPLCEGRDVKIVLGGPYNSGILAKGVRRGGELHYNYQPAPPAIVARVGAIEDLCAEHGVPLAAAALQLPLAHPQVVSVIPGMNSPRQVAQAVALIDTLIPPALWSDLKDRGLIRADTPIPTPRLKA